MTLLINPPLHMTLYMQPQFIRVNACSAKVANQLFLYVAVFLGVVKFHNAKHGLHGETHTKGLVVVVGGVNAVVGDGIFNLGKEGEVAAPLVTAQCYRNK